MDGMKVLHVGMDGLDVSFKGALPEAALTMLAAAKERAQTEHCDQLITLGKLQCYVGRTGTSGGYAFRLDTGFDGEVWFIKKSTDPSQWNIRVSVRALPLATMGYARVRDRLQKRLDDMGARVIEESISRVDMAVDFLAPGFEPDPQQIVAHWRCRRGSYGQGEIRPAEIGGDDMQVFYSGRKVTSVTIGTMPNRQVIIYDKRREAIDTKKGHWFDIWALEAKADDESTEQAAERLRRNPALKVWRIEVRAGKNYLTDFDLRTFADLEATLGDVIREALGQVRYLEPRAGDSNVTRRAPHEIWSTAGKALGDKLAESEAGILPLDIRSGREKEIQALYRGMMAGFSASYAVALKLSGDDVDKLANQIANDIATYIEAHRDKFEASQGRARRRLHFITEGTEHEGTA